MRLNLKEFPNFCQLRPYDNARRPEPPKAIKKKTSGKDCLSLLLGCQVRQELGNVLIAQLFGMVFLVVKDVFANPKSHFWLSFHAWNRRLL